MEISVVVGMNVWIDCSINDGVWSIYYLLLFFFIMIMWKPSENSSEYAYHIQVATNADDVEIMKRKS